MDETYSGSADTDVVDLDSSVASSASSDSSIDCAPTDAAGGQFASAEAGFNVPGVTKSSRFAANGAPLTEPIPVDVAAFVTGLAGACDGLLAVDMDAAPGCLPALLEQLVVQQSRLSAVVCRFTAGLTKHGDPDMVGRFSASAWLQSRTRMPQGEATRIAKVSAGVFGEDSVLPRTRAAFSDGRITTAHAEEMARGADKFEPEDRDRLLIEELLLNVALASTASKVKTVAQEMADTLKPDKHEDNEKSDYDRRDLSAVSTFGNTVDIRGFAAGLEGQEILDFFHRITIAPQGPDDTRNRGQRCFDGFLDFIRSHQDEQPSMGGFRPGIIVTAEFSEVIRLLGHHTGQDVPEVPTIDDLRRIVAAHLGVHSDEIRYDEDQEEATSKVNEDENDDEGEELGEDENSDDLIADAVIADAEEPADNSDPTDPCDIKDAANQPPLKSDVDNSDPRRSIPRQRSGSSSATPPKPAVRPVLAPSPPAEPDPPSSRTGRPPDRSAPPIPPRRQPSTGVGPSSSLPTADQLTDSAPPTTWMPTWRDFVEAAQRITDPKIRHLLNGAAATMAWAEAPHISTQAPGTRTLNGQPISAGTLRRLMCDAKIMPAIFDGRGQILDLGAAKRTFSVAQRRALVLRDKHCRWRGCTMPYQFCEAHHLVPFEFHGPTNIDDGILLCCNHHHRTHEKNVDVLKHLDLPEPVRQLAAYYSQLQIDRRRDGK